MPLTAVRVISGVFGGQEERGEGERLADRVVKAFPGVKVIPPTLTDAMPLVERLAGVDNGFLWVDCGYNSSDEGTMLTAPAHRHSVNSYLGSDALGWYCSGFIPALVRLLLLREETGAAAAMPDAVRLQWFAVRSFDAKVVDLVDPFVPSSTGRSAPHRPREDASSSSSPSSFSLSSASSLRHLVLRDVRGFLEHVERVAATPSFSRARERLSHVFWLTWRGVSCVTCVLHEAHTSGFARVLDPSVDLRGQQDYPLSFLRTMQAVKVGLSLNTSVFRASRVLPETAPLSCWCVRIGSHQWEDPLGVLPLLQRLQGTPNGGEALSTSSSSRGLSCGSTHEQIGRAKRQMSSRGSTVRRIMSVEAAIGEQDTDAAAAASRCLAVTHTREVLVLEKERLQHMETEAREAKERRVLLQHETDALRQETSALRAHIDSLRRIAGADKNVHHCAVSGTSWVEQQQQQQYTPHRVAAHYGDVEEQLQRRHQAQLAKVIEQQDMAQAQLKRFSADQAEKRRVEEEIAQEELQRLQDDADAAEAEILRLQQHEMKLSMQQRLQTSSVTLTQELDSLQGSADDVANTSQLLLLNRSREMRRVEAEVQLLQDEVDATRKWVLRMSDAGEEKELQVMPTSQHQKQQRWLRSAAWRTLQWREALGRVQLEDEWLAALLACWRWRMLECCALTSASAPSPLKTALRKANEDYAALQQEWEQEQRLQTIRHRRVEEAVEDAKRHNADVQRELRELRARCSASTREQQRTVAEMRAATQRALQRIAAVVEWLTREENEVRNNNSGSGSYAGVRRAVHAALRVGCHLGPRTTRQKTLAESHGGSRAQDGWSEELTPASLLLVQQACDGYLRLCEGLEQRQKLRGEVDRVSESCGLMEAALTRTRQRMLQEQQTVRQLAAVAAKLEELERN
ncbi:hypothetical protein DQ04_06171010 [Trypanosoma grayi]|uniref:hypothetical protein n=1 Tax=Trypanosoma grayi TaxID=71804 RepID=UPI0004F4A585|nr:hypothetical protein DQ04_06171010 [Trypanosoma grayi]KEG08920.1 hypothetical protein DQ04_06171010 [Trypanosoma grayi]